MNTRGLPRNGIFTNGSSASNQSAAEPNNNMNRKSSGRLPYTCDSSTDPYLTSHMISNKNFKSLPKGAMKTVLDIRRHTYMWTQQHSKDTSSAAVGQIQDTGVYASRASISNLTSKMSASAGQAKRSVQSITGGHTAVLFP